MSPGLLGLFLVAVVAGVATTWVARGVARRTGFVANPNPIVPSHTEAVAYMGGVGIVTAAAIVVPVAVAAQLAEGPSLAVSVAAVSFAGIGLLDDVVAMSPAVKLAWQMVAGCAASWLVQGWLGVPLWAELPLSVLLIATVVNAVNFTDVCDGLVGGLAAVALLALSVVHPHPGPLVVLAGASVGFVYWNYAPASVYMGDAGSHMIGAVLAVAAFEVVAERPGLPALLGVAAICGVFLFELLFITSVRAWKGLSIFRGSPDHFSLRMQAGGFSRGTTALIAWGVGAVFGLCGVAAVLGPSRLAWAFLLPVVVACVAAPVPLLKWEVQGARPRES